MSERFIVAEISKNWPEPDDRDRELWDAIPDYRNSQGMRRLLAQRFEDVLNTNDQRGYKLIDWKVHRVFRLGGEINETIIAVFELTL